MYYGIAGIVSLALTLYSWWAYTAPFRWFASVQSAIWGVNILNLSLLGTWILAYLPMHFVVHKVEQRYGVQRAPVTWQRLVQFGTFVFETGPGKVVGIGALLFVMGTCFWAQSAGAGPLTEFSMLAAERGDEPKSGFVRVTHATVDMRAELSFKRNGSVEHYYPVVAQSAPGELIRVFIKRDNVPRVGEPAAEVRGMVEVDGLPGALREHVRAQGLLAPKYWVVSEGSEPAERSSFAWKLTLVGAVIGAVGAVWAKLRFRTTA
jgi:hypothetical protein